MRLFLELCRVFRCCMLQGEESSVGAGDEQRRGCRQPTSTSYGGCSRTRRLHHQPLHILESIFKDLTPPLTRPRFLRCRVACRV